MPDLNQVMIMSIYLRASFAVKLGSGTRFLYLLTELEQLEGVRSIDAYTELTSQHLLSQVQARILHLEGKQGLNLAENDRSLTFHSCHSPMREVEVLHDYLLHLFQQDSTLTPKILW